MLNLGDHSLHTHKMHIVEGHLLSDKHTSKLIALLPLHLPDHT